MEFILTIIIELLAVVAIPLALRFQAWQRWLRVALLVVPLVGSTIMYFVYDRQTFLYLSVILLIALIFLYGSIRNNSKL